jgi:small subunit ribosomal protein S9
VANDTQTKKVFLGTGRRKTAVARCRVFDGSGQVTINGRALDQYFTEVKDREAVLAPLYVVDMRTKLDIAVTVRGGGITGQSGAICQGVARALKVMYTPTDVPPPPPPPAEGAEGAEAAPVVPAIPPLVKKIRDSGLLTRDARMKERKKYGRRGARRSFQFSKR